MKKIYNIPTIEVINTNAQNILAGSFTGIQGEYDGSLPLKSKESFDVFDFDVEVEN